MAIVFEKNLSVTDLLFAYNNNTVTFKQSSTSLVAKKATVFFNNQLFTLFPDPNGKFYFNFKYSAPTFINDSNFADGSCFNLAEQIATTFKNEVIADGGTFEAFDCLVEQLEDLGIDPIIDWTDNIYKEFSVVYKIFYTNDTEDTSTQVYSFLSAYVNYQNYKQLYPNYPYNADTTQMMLKPITYLKYWNGYPFDFTWYNGLMNDIVIGNVLYENSNFLKSFEYTLTTTPTANKFYTPLITWTRVVGQTVSFKFDSTGAENIFAAISVNDIIKVTTGVLAGYKFKVTSISVSGTVYTFSLEILTLSGFVPNEGQIIPFIFELQNDVIEIDTITNDKRINRIIVSNGTELIELESAYNRLLVNGTELQIEKITDICEGHYIKWLNSFGGWNYWLFYKGNDTLTTKDLGQIFNDYEDVVDTVSPYVSIGKTSENNIAVVQDNITQNEMLILNDLLDTPKVYLFTGSPNQTVDCKDWLEVTIKSGAFRVLNSKEKMNSLRLTIEIPTNTTKIL
jgi:hypothetical protein